MFITLLIAALVASTLYYVFFFVRVQIGLKRLRPPVQSPGDASFVSVVVAARNEESTIAGCVGRILNQQYNPGLELIVVNDNSSDATESILRKIADERPNLRIVTLANDREAGSGGKPVAISAGVDAARGDIVATTDADCVVPPTWVRTMVNYLEPGVALVSGPVREETDEAFISRIGHLELLGLITTAAGLIGANHPIICNGANLAYRKSAFLAALGDTRNQGWCDDDTLMQRIHVKRLGKIVFAASPDAVVTTSSKSSITGFWKQRLRWSAMGGHHEQSTTLISVVGLYVFFVLLLAVLVLSLSFPELCIWFVLSLAVKIVVDYTTLAAGARLLLDFVSIPVFLVAQLFHVPYIVVTAALGQLAPLNWKGRRLNS